MDTKNPNKASYETPTDSKDTKRKEKKRKRIIAKSRRIPKRNLRSLKRGHERILTISTLFVSQSARKQL